MECPDCHRRIASLAKFCPNCGARIPTSGKEVESARKAGAAERDSAGAAFDQELAKTESELDRGLGALEAELHETDLELGPEKGLTGELERESVGLRGRYHVSSPPRVVSQRSLTSLYAHGRLEAVRFDELAPSEHNWWSAVAAAQEEVAVEELVLRPESAYQIAAFVLHSPFVLTNELYRSKAAETGVIVDENTRDADLVNAFAVEAPQNGETRPVIVILRGFVHAVSLGGYAIAGQLIGGETLRPVLRSLGHALAETGGLLDFDQTVRLLETEELSSVARNAAAKQTAASCSAAMAFNVIAHELGHIALGHTLGSRLSDEVSRNQEREADSFASSAAATSAFADYLLLGGIVWHMILVWMEDAAGVVIETSHPAARDRLRDYIHRHQESAAELGVTEQTVGEFLPPK